MALSAGSLAQWSDLNNLYRRVNSEKTRWGRSTTVTAGAQDTKIMTAHGQSLRTAMVDLVNNISYLSTFKAAVTSTAAIAQGNPINVATLNTLKSAVNGMRTAFGYATGAHNGTVSTGFSSFKTSDTKTWSGYTSYWSFFDGGCFGASSTDGFTFKTTNTTHNPNCVNCTSGYYNCNPFCTAGFCTSYYSDAI